MKTLFIVNPISGGKKQPAGRWADLISTYFPQAEIKYTQYAGHATELASHAVQNGYEKIFVAGGDGTINEVARALVGTSITLGIVPKGSGNGLARELAIPLCFEKALAALQKAQAVSCDVGLANGEYFFNVAGVGIEAEIARQFDQFGKSGKRGKWPYFKLGIQGFFHYKPASLRLQYEGKEEVICPLTLVFANGTQYGSGFYIAPQASLTDGKLEMVEVKNVSKIRLACAAPAFFRKKPLPATVQRTQSITQAILQADGEIVYHLDGEPKVAQQRLEIKLLPHALRLLMPTGEH